MHAFVTTKFDALVAVLDTDACLSALVAREFTSLRKQIGDGEHRPLQARRGRGRPDHQPRWGWFHRGRLGAQEEARGRGQYGADGQPSGEAGRGHGRSKVLSPGHSTGTAKRARGR
ncbi:hypothetical protein GQ600_22976 [Phytophthora cactorum]|nr:hypothetical protein GQ600_22976 [Phytophthora cactorum]